MLAGNRSFAPLAPATHTTHPPAALLATRYRLGYIPRMSDEKRDGDRVPMLGDLVGEVMVYEPMVIKEVSVGGATVETRFPLHLNSLHDLRLTLGSRSVVVKGRVVHSRISDVDQDIVTYRTGVEFVEPPERVLHVIAEFLDSVKSDRSGV